MYLLLAAWRAKRRLGAVVEPAVPPRYVRKAKVHHRTYAARIVPVSRAVSHRLTALKRLRRYDVAAILARATRELQPRHGTRRAPSGIATLVRRQHTAANAREKAPARERTAVFPASARNEHRAAIVRRWARQQIAERGVATVRRHSADLHRDRRNSTLLPYIGLCWDTAEMERIPG